MPPDAAARPRFPRPCVPPAAISQPRAPMTRGRAWAGQQQQIHVPLRRLKRGRAPLAPPPPPPSRPLFPSFEAHACSFAFPLGLLYEHDR
jgi:hypothetical protein